jgi:hypothetical protein
MQDAQTRASLAEKAKEALAAAQADMEHCSSSLRHLEQLQDGSLKAHMGAGDMAKQLAELRFDIHKQTIIHHKAITFAYCACEA